VIEMRKIVQITPCVDWFYVGNSEGVGDVVCRVAAWALYEDGVVLGLVSENVEVSASEAPQLNIPPEYPGEYLHVTQLTKWQRNSIGIPQ
jgi:hypothetical protein